MKKKIESYGQSSVNPDVGMSSRKVEAPENEDLVLYPKDMKFLNRIAIRVLHYRSPLECGKIISWMKIDRIARSTLHFLLHLCTQART